MNECQTTTMQFDVSEARDAESEWLVEAIDRESEGEVYMARFSGPGAKRRAEEYANWMNRRRKNARMGEDQDSRSATAVQVRGVRSPPVEGFVRTEEGT